MKFFVNQHDNNNVSLITDAGYVLGYFPSIDEALDICDEWYTSNSREKKQEVKILPVQNKSINNKYLNYFGI